jgi:pimeloyl-ACP methyl ester carboxylesterase
MLSHNLRVLYLHGFASSPNSRKARFFSEKLTSEGIVLETPALDGGDFCNLTITGQIAIVQQLTGDDPVVLIGSSLGGYIAALHAARNPNVQRLVLLAPAFSFHRLWRDRMDSVTLDNWKRRGSMPVFHYSEGRELLIGFQLMEDSARYEPWPNFLQPALIFHGTGDPSVPVEYSAEFVQNHESARLITLASGHELTDVLEPIWDLSAAFLLGR